MADIYSLLRRKFPESEYALMKEVSDKAGFSRSRSADYIIMNLWPSRGLSLTGFEEKRSRGDWLNELKRPAKAENIFQYCDYFYLITHSENVARMEEIPEPWGWMNVKGERIYTLKPAPKLEPKQMSRHFMACMLKRAASKDGYILKSEIQDQLKASSESEYKILEIAHHRLEAKYTRVLENLKKFREHTGIDISLDEYVGQEKMKDIGEAVRIITNQRTGFYKNRVDIVVDEINRLLETARIHQQNLNKILSE